MRKTSVTYKNKKNIVVIGGGTGAFTVLSGLKKYNHNLSAIVSMADDGGSTGVLREEFGILPPGDIRRCLVALSHSDKVLADLFNYRFKEGGVRGHSFGNLLITAFERMNGSFEKAIEHAGKILGVEGDIIPVALENTRLWAKLENGQIIKGETNIDIPKHNGNLKIKEVYLKPKVSANSRAKMAIAEADLIILGPGDLYTSIIPNLLVRGISGAIKKSKAKKVYVCNLMTKFGETNEFSAKDFARELERYLGENVINIVVFNNKKPSPQRLKKYAEEKAVFVDCNLKDFWQEGFTVVLADLLRARGFLRHDPGKLARTLTSLI